MRDDTPEAGPGAGALSPRQAAAAWAKAWNTLDPGHVEALLDDDVRYASQSVLDEIEGKADLLTYLAWKMRTVGRLPGAAVFAELGELPAFGPCVVMAQGTRNALAAVVLFRIEGGRMTRIDMCTVAPHPSEARRSGVYPLLPPY